MSKTAKEGVSLTKFGEILMQLRQEKHLSQAELGHIIYVSGGTISNYEKGVHYPDVEKLVRLADYFNVSITSKAAITRNLRWRYITLVKTAYLQLQLTRKMPRCVKRI